MSDTPDLLEVGYIAKAHGLAGDVIVRLTSDRTERLDAGSILQTDDGPMEVLRSQPYQDRWLVTFVGVNARETADSLRSTVLRAAPIDEPDSLFIHELIGRPVTLVDGTPVGVCAAVLDNPAHDLIELEDGRLIPVTFVVDASDVVTVDVPEGLLDL